MRAGRSASGCPTHGLRAEFVVLPRQAARSFGLVIQQILGNTLRERQHRGGNAIFVHLRRSDTLGVHGSVAFDLCTP